RRSTLRESAARTAARATRTSREAPVGKRRRMLEVVERRGLQTIVADRIGFQTLRVIACEAVDGRRAGGRQRLTCMQLLRCEVIANARKDLRVSRRFVQ